MEILKKGNEITVNGKVIKPMYMTNVRSRVYLVEIVDKMDNQTGEKGEILEERVGKMARIQEFGIDEVRNGSSVDMIKIIPNKESGLGAIEVPAEWKNADQMLETRVFIEDDIAVAIEQKFNQEFELEGIDELSAIEKKRDAIIAGQLYRQQRMAAIGQRLNLE